MEQAVIIDGARTAFGSFGGALKDIGATELGVEVAKAAIARSGVDVKSIGESISTRDWALVIRRVRLSTS